MCSSKRTADDDDNDESDGIVIIVAIIILVVLLVLLILVCYFCFGKKPKPSKGYTLPGAPLDSSASDYGMNQSGVDQRQYGAVPAP